LLPQFVLPYLRFSVTVIALFLMARLRVGHTLVAAAALAGLPNMPHQRGQFWIRRFQKQAESLCAALATVTAPMAALNFVSNALHMLQAIGWIAAYRFLFADLRLGVFWVCSFLFVTI